MKAWKTWTVKELHRLEEMRLAGRSFEEIAAELGRTVHSAKCRCAIEGVRKPRAAESWLAAFAKPHTTTALARERGVTVWAVRNAKRRLRRAGFDVQPAEGTKARAKAC